ncbi:MAG: dockerin type I domain-containing protein [Planctomycetota bacterium]
MRPTLLIAAILALLARLAPASAATVWSGPETTFTRPPGEPDVVDPLTGNVVLARGNLRGLYNAVVEESGGGQNSSTPTGTLWATSINNPGAVIDAAQFADLDFDTWYNAYGGGNLAVNIPGTEAVVHLVADDIYLNLRVTIWDAGNAGGNGGFSYSRSTPATGVLAGDYNGDKHVDAADYTVWRDSLGDPSSGLAADGDGDGVIDMDDYTVWRNNFGAPGAETGTGAATAPEPVAAGLAFLALARLIDRCAVNARQN